LGQNKEDTYKAFCDYILPAVCGHKTNQVKFNQLKICEIATPSEEAFGLLLLENAWDRWSYQAANPKLKPFPLLSTVMRDLQPEQQKCMLDGKHRVCIGLMTYKDW
jgi:hypothetical protein